MKLAEWLVGVICLALSALLLRESFLLPRIAVDPGGLALMPQVFAVVTGVAALFLLGGLVRDALGRGTTAVSLWEPWGRREVAVVAVLTALYPFVMLKVGFLIATMIYVAAVLVVLRAGLVTGATVTIVAPVGLYYAFDKVLRVHLPGGEWLAELLA